MGVGANRLAGLDGLRGLAALAVLLCHAIPGGLVGGGLGVDVFFVLSGYLITSLLAAELNRTGAINYRAFMARRMRRLYPALLFLIAVFALVSPAIWPGSTWEIVPAALYFTNLTRSFDLGSNLSHTWSLAVEFQFYLAWPLILPLILRTRRPLMVLAALYIVAVAVRMTLPELPAFNLRTSGLFLGALAALVPWSMPRAAIAPALAAVLIAMACLTRVATAELWAMTVVELATGIVVIAASRCRSVLSAAPLVWLGQISYGLYLWHAPIANVLRRLGEPPLTVLAWTLALGIAMAWISRRYVEEPFLVRTATAPTS